MSNRVGPTALPVSRTFSYDNGITMYPPYEPDKS